MSSSSPDSSPQAGNTSLTQIDPTKSFISLESDNVVRIAIFVLCGGLNHILAFFGMVANVINIAVFAKMGFKETINISLVGLAVSDMLCSVTLAATSTLMIMASVEMNLSFRSEDVLYMTAYWPHCAVARITGAITAFIAFERCLCVLMPLKIKQVITHRRVVVCLVVIFLGTLFMFSPILYVFGLDWVYRPELNRTLYSLVTLPNRDKIEPIYYPVIGVVNPLFSVFAVSTCTILLVVTLKKQGKWRQSFANAQSSTTTGASDKSGGDNQGAVDTNNTKLKSQSKDRKASILVVSISTLFLVCFIPVFIVTTVIIPNPEISMGGKERALYLLLWNVVFFFESVNSSSNIFIYYYKNNKFRNVFNQMFKRKV